MEEHHKLATAATTEIYRRSFHSSPDFISITRMWDGLYIDVNPGYERFIGRPRSETIGRSSLDVGVWPQAADRQRFLQALQDHGEVHEYRAHLKNFRGELRNVEIAASTVGTGDERLLIAIVRDVTERHHEAVELQQYREHLEILVQHRTTELRNANSRLLAAHGQLEQAHQRLLKTEKRLRYMALHDSLTGLPNRNLLHDRIAHAISLAERSGKQMGLLFIDLDNFKHINDSLGHLIGDDLLRSVAARVQRNVRKSDTIARLGGDEFVICVSGLDDGGKAALLAQKTLRSLDAPFLVDGHQFHIGASIGISLYPADGGDAETLMQAADTAMYHAKANGRNNYQFFTPALSTAVQQRLAIESQLHEALPRGEFVLHYQPQVDLDTGRVISAEALLRWQRPAGDLLSPLDFIPVAEETGIIVRIGEWVLREACRQLQHWRAAGFGDMGIAVNLSARQVLQPGFTETVAGILAEAGLPANALDLEITESVLMEPIEENVAALRRLADLGVRLSVDDFGTGYSSLSYLKRFPIYALKIDRSFVHGIAEDASDAAIVSTIIAMAQTLRLAVIAEGVETAEQVQFLAAHGCRLAQGYYFGRPAEAHCLASTLAADSPVA